MRAVMKRLFGEEFNNLLFMNLLTAALCVPIITAGPALMALMGTLIKIVDNRCELNRLKEYKALFKKKFFKGVLFEAVVLLYGAAILWCFSLADALGEGGTVLRVATLAVGFIACVVSVPVWLILAGVEMPFGAAFWNGVCFALGRFPLAAMSALWVYGVVLAAVLFYPVSLAFVVMILISAMAVIALAILWPAYGPLVLEACEERRELEE